MSTEKVKKYLAQFGLADRVIEFDVSSATVALAAHALGCEPAHIAKTLSFRLPNEPILVVAAGDAKVDNHKFRDTFGVKAKMLTPDQTQQEVGFAVGGVCPFAVNAGVRVFLDESLRRFEVIYPAAGTDSSAVRLTPDELEDASNCEKWVDVCRLPEQDA